MSRPWSPYYVMRAPRGRRRHLVDKENVGTTLCRRSSARWVLEPDDTSDAADCDRCHRAREAA